MHGTGLGSRALILVAATCLAACGRTWVSVETSGCSDATVGQLTADGPHGKSEMMGVGICNAHGLNRYAGSWRCRGDTLQVACGANLKI